MKVRVHPGDRHGVGHCRILYPAAACQDDVEIEIADRLPITRAIARDGTERLIAAELDADVLVFQRPSNPEMVGLIGQLQARGHAVVIDVDDDAHSLNPRNLAAGQESPRMILRACALADLVTVSTPALARRYAPHGRVEILENCVPGALLDMPRTGDGATVGWTGFTGTHPGDLEITHGGVQQALERIPGAHFLQVGPGTGVARALGLAGEPRATGGLQIEDYHRALGALDVGICPLAPTTFNDAKSALKPLEMAARGAAVVLSPRAEYARLSHSGIGVLASDRARSWRARICELLDSAELRAEMSGRARELIAERHTYEGQGWRWAAAWERALQLRHADARHGALLA